MLYINDPKQTYKTYDEVMQFVISNGVEAKRVYIYLASLGVKSGLVRAISADGVDYLPSVKAAVKGNQVITKLDVCKHCGSLVIE